MRSPFAHPDASAPTGAVARPGRQTPLHRRSIDEDPETYQFDDAHTLVGPRSLAELERVLSKRGGWYAAQASTVPHRMIAVLEDLANAKLFPKADLPAATALVTQAFLREGVIRPSRRTFDLADVRGEAPWGDVNVEFLRRLMHRIRQLGRVEVWGQKHQTELPSAPERLTAAAMALQAELVEDSVRRYERWASAVDALAADDPQMTTGLKEPAVLRENRAQIITQVWRQLVHAVAYQELADRYPLTDADTPQPRVRPAPDAPLVGAAEHGAMILDLTSRMLAERSGRIKTSTAALLDIAGLEIPTVLQPTKGFYQIARRIGKFVDWIEPTASAGALIETSVDTGQAVDQWLQQRRQLSAVVAATILAPIYVNAETPPADVVQPAELLEGRHYGEFRAAIEAEALRQGRSVRDVLQDPVVRTKPVSLLRGHQRNRLALEAATRWLRAADAVPVADRLRPDAYITAWFATHGPWANAEAEAAAQHWIRTGVVRDGWSPDDHGGTKQLAALRGMFRDGEQAPLPHTILQSTWAAALLIGATAGGRRLETARVATDRLPLSAQGETPLPQWEVELGLPSAGLALMQGAALSHAAWQSAMAVAAGAPVTPERPLQSRHLSSLDTGGVEALTRVYVEAFSDGAIVARHPHPDTGLPWRESLARLEASEGLVHLQPDRATPDLVENAESWDDLGAVDLGDGWVRRAVSARISGPEHWVVSGSAAARPNPLQPHWGPSRWLPPSRGTPMAQLAARVLQGLVPTPLGKTSSQPVSAKPIGERGRPDRMQPRPRR